MSYVAVFYASTHHSTQEIAVEIGERLTKAGFQVDVRPFEEVHAIDRYDAFVLGSAVHNMAWLIEATSFIRSHVGDLSFRPVWLFSVSSVGETSSFFGPHVARFMRWMRMETREIVGLKTALHAHDHRTFAGAVLPGHWSRAGSLFLKAFGGSYGDHRDWIDIDAWADGIARELHSSLELDEVPPSIAAASGFA